MNGDKQYVLPHLRGSGKKNESRQISTGFFSSQSGNNFFTKNRYNESERRGHSSSRWVGGKHNPAPRNDQVEEKIFGPATEITTKGINFDNYEDIPVEATGSNIPEPITEFESPPLDPLLLENILLAHFTKPTPVQKYSIPIVCDGRDLMGCAQTGSGKTGGFLFPILSEMFKTGPLNESLSNTATSFYMRKGLPTALILAPTRELATQIFSEASKFNYRSWVKTCVVYGGAPIGNQMRQVDRGCDILVATPGRLNDLLERGKISLSNIRYLILDEADRMLDMGFEPQIRHIVEECDMPHVDKRQTLMFSATFPQNIQHLARDFLSDYVFLSVGRVGSTSENITQKVVYVEDFDKKSALLDILAGSHEGVTLIFVETKRMADSLTDFLITQKFSATAIHGDRTQIERERALDAFKTGRADILVATAVAARGLDIPHVKLVVNYDLPSDIDDYVHRIGRTGRAGNTGVALSFFNINNQNIVDSLLEILMEANQEVPSFLRDFSRKRGPSKNYGFGSGGRQPRRGGRFENTRDYRKPHEVPRTQRPSNTQSWRNNDVMDENTGLQSDKSTANSWW